MFDFLSSRSFAVPPETTPVHLEADFFYLVQSLSAIASAILYAFHIPERIWPGRFDILGQSHQIFHLTAFSCTWSQFVALKLDMKHLIIQDYADRHFNVDDEFYVLTDHSIQFDSRTRVPFTDVKLSCSCIIVACLVLNSIILAYYYHKAVYYNPWLNVSHNTSEKKKKAS